MRPLYRLSATVIRGKQLGRKLGFATANLAYDARNHVLPNGVYVCSAQLPDAGTYFGVLNQGVHPTFPQGAPTIELHLFGWTGDLYGVALEVEYLHFLRPETRFADAQALQAQLREDVAHAHAWLAEHAPTLFESDGE